MCQVESSIDNYVNCLAELLVNCQLSLGSCEGGKPLVCSLNKCAAINKLSHCLEQKRCPCLPPFSPSPWANNAESICRKSDKYCSSCFVCSDKQLQQQQRQHRRQLTNFHSWLIKTTLLWFCCKQRCDIATRQSFPDLYFVFGGRLPQCALIIRHVLFHLLTVAHVQQQQKQQLKQQQQPQCASAKLSGA